MEKALTVHSVPAAALINIMAELEHDKTDTTAGAVTAAEACNQHARGYLVKDGEKTVMAYLLAFQNCAQKRVCWVTGARGNAPGHDLTAEVLPVIEQQAREGGAQQIAITTKRRGLAKKISDAGFMETGRTYRKNLL